VPTLRNIEVTAPYMHYGSIKTLKEVIDHYNSGGKNHSNKSPLIKLLNLTKDESNNLHAFLLTLTDNEFLNNPNFKE
jgi:cytochrome c peroxidase